MQVDTFKELANYGVPLAILVAVGWLIVTYFVKPFGGTDGIIAKYFQTQSEQYQRQGEIAEKHQRLTEKLTEVCSEHHKESGEFYARSEINMSELLQVHHHIVAALSSQFSDDQARKELSQADAIIRRHMEKH